MCLTIILEKTFHSSKKQRMEHNLYSQVLKLFLKNHNWTQNYSFFNELDI